jgi:hypothetical protein
VKQESHIVDLKKNLLNTRAGRQRFFRAFALTSAKPKKERESGKKKERKKRKRRVRNNKVRIRAFSTPP